MSWLIIALVRLYQVVISPVLHFVTGPFSGCRFAPTCSQYFIDSVRVHGPFKGPWLGFRRICRCHPWGGEGYDPVPGWKEFEKSHPEFAHRENRASVGGSAAGDVPSEEIPPRQEEDERLPGAERNLD